MNAAQNEPMIILLLVLLKTSFPCTTTISPSS